MLLFILIAMKYMVQPGYKQLALLCLATAMFITIKYTGAILMPFIAIVVIYTSIRDKDYWKIIKQGLFGGFSMCVLCVFDFPVLFTNFTAAKNAFLKEARTTHLGAMD